MSQTFALTFFPALAAFLYTVGALLLKRSADLGVGLWRTTFVVNMIVATLFSVTWLFGGKPVQLHLIWQPGAIALCLFVGQLTQFIALERGDVSVAVPVFGLKVVIVALLTPILTADTLPLKVWIASCLSVVGIFFMNRKDETRPPRHLGITLLAGGVCSLCFAMFDVLMQKWGLQWGAGRLLPLTFWINAVLSFSLIAMFKAPLSTVPRAAWSWLVPGSALMGIQSIMFVGTVATFGKATSANVIYASRGLISVIMVWMVGHWFLNQEQHLGSRILRFRLLGATLMLAAIVLVMV